MVSCALTIGPGAVALYAQSAQTDTVHTPMSASMTMSQAPLGVPMQRGGSGTSWQPDASPMRASHVTLGKWEVMLHGSAFVQFDDQGSSRGSRQFGSVNWGMVAASRPLAGGTFGIRGMASAEPVTVGAHGYPLLLQSGESYRGQPLHDRQHPHDLFMEIAALYDHAVGRNVALSLYAAPVGEPAIGPVAFPHRVSASSDPLAPLGHHWQDATHISFGVITAAVYTKVFKLEGSIFNGREPDEIRTNFDYKGRSLDSYAGRITVNPGSSWSVSGSYAYLKSPEQLDPAESVHRFAASVMHDRPIGKSGNWASTFIYGANKHASDQTVSSSALAESNLELGDGNTIFGRAEFVQKSPEDLVVPPPSTVSASHSILLDVGEVTLGYVRDVGRARDGRLGVGFAGTLNVVPQSLRAVYGSRTPAGGVIFVRIRPGVMNAMMHTNSRETMPMHDMHNMNGSER